jgi:uncharacterized membrane protein YeaQ/YmgE (transglycosylase-associated protein family)
MVGAGFMIMGFLLIGMAAGWAAWLAYGKRYEMSWLEMFFVGILGSFVGGTLTHLIVGEGLQISMSGFIGSIIGAIIVLPIFSAIRARFQRSAEE